MSCSIMISTLFTVLALKWCFQITFHAFMSVLLHPLCLLLILGRHLLLPLFHSSWKFMTLPLPPFPGQSTLRSVWVGFFLILMSVTAFWRVSTRQHTWVQNTCTASCGPVGIF